MLLSTAGSKTARQRSIWSPRRIGWAADIRMAASSSEAEPSSPRNRPRWRFAKTDAVHRPPHTLIAHEPLPDIAGHQVLGAEQADAYVNPDHVGIHPAGDRIERIRETVAAPDAVAVKVLHFA